MTTSAQLERFADETFHSVILEFNPGVPSTYYKCVKILENLEQEIESTQVRLATKHSLLVSIWTHLALMASEVKDYLEAERLALKALKLASTKHPDFAVSVLLLTQALHALGRHEEEVAEGLMYAESEGVTGPVLVCLLADLARRHPESIEWKDSLISRVRAFVKKTPELVERMKRFSFSKKDPRGYILSLADTVRQISLEKTASALGETEST